MHESVVQRGPAEAVGTVLVLDPVGAASHGEVPATWRPLAEQWTVVWCRLPVQDSAWQLAEFLQSIDGPVDVVAAGRSSAAALALACRHSEVIRSVLLVDPADGPTDEQWLEREAPAIEALSQRGVDVRVVAACSPDERDRRDPPLPLGHPDVVAVLQAQLTSLRRC